MITSWTGRSRRATALIAALVVTASVLLAGSVAQPVAGQTAAIGSAPSALPAPPGTLEGDAAGQAAPDPAGGAAAGPGELAWVPVLRFWTPRHALTLDEVRAAVEGRDRRFRRVLVAGPDPTRLWAVLGVTPATTTRMASYPEVVRGLEGSKRVLGLVPAGEVTPVLRALRVDGRSLFGGDRVRDLGDWPLRAPVDAAAAADGAAGQGVGDDGVANDGPIYDPARTWTLLAGGDVMLDREVHRLAVLQGRGPGYPWSGGFARITARTCCTVDGGPAIRTRAAGPRGALRSLLSAADITLVNHEGPAPDDARYHPHGLVFNFDPSLLRGLADAGIDLVSLANNHIRNAGSPGVLQTIRNLRRAGIRSVGAAGDAEHARRPTCTQVGEVRACVLAYDAINTVVHAATADRPGAAELISAHVRTDIRRLRREGADVIVVMPHWGTEYVTSVTAQQRRWARAMVRAGADVVLGAHSHVVGPVEIVDGVPVLYSLGNLLFDLPRFEATEEGVLAELTFVGDRLAQLDLHPTVIVDRARVMLLDPADDGDVVLARMRRASSRLD